MHNKVLGVFLIFVTIPLVMLSIISLGTGKLSTATYYKNLFKKADAYKLAIQALPKSETTKNDDIIAQISNDMTPVWLEQTITKNLDQFDAYFNGRTTAIDPSIDITAFKGDLTATLPAEFKSVVPDVISFTTYNDYLNQTEKLVSENSGLIQTEDQSNSEQIQQQLESTRKTQQQFFTSLSSAKQGYHFVIILKYVLYVLTILMLLTIVLAARHWYPAILRWAGQTLLISGVATLGFFFAIQKIALGFNLIDKTSLSDSLKQILKPLYNNIFQDITFGVEKIALIVALIGLLFIIASYILPFFSPEAKKVTPVSANS
ncbi:TPA: hypothetical protein DD449_00395 [Candidatus Berkelbacteria bacterium]|uniref:Uncharacterized protein n=1 Tax=Berkelbacteria bacterium GW2011_GWE1_39_12 TaxID=1618337 RepID=A0A0G4B5V6_9BACT|nr:MAG: hypothetical protein UT28_C0001G1009 [Berkelbacteria bacterium GW2011_GWE1_39_12]HBO60133.1 hypothetical protein [Candidatus Berkelbacteria bacterium]